MSIILKGINLPKPIKDKYTYLELYVRSDGVVFDDDFEEVGKAIQIPKGHGRLIFDVWDGSTKRGSFEILIDDTPTILEAEE